MKNATARSDNKSPADRAGVWWRGLSGLPDGKKADLAMLANLRRCRKPVEALQCSATFALLARLPKPDWVDSNRYREDRVAALAVILAHVREDNAVRVARAIGRKTLSENDSALLSEARFRRLMQTDGPEELLTNMVRLVRHMGGKVNVVDLAHSVLFWGDKLRRDWAFAYYAASIANPDISRAASQKKVL